MEISINELQALAACRGGRIFWLRHFGRGPVTITAEVIKTVSEYDPSFVTWFYSNVDHQGYMKAMEVREQAKSEVWNDFFTNLDYKARAAGLRRCDEEADAAITAAIIAWAEDPNSSLGSVDDDDVDSLETLEDEADLYDADFYEDDEDTDDEDEDFEPPDCGSPECRLCY